MKIDAHQHFWHFTENDYGWISAEQSIIRRDFLPEDLIAVYDHNMIDACIAVQARQSLEETHWLIDLAAEYHFIKGIVGWVDLKSESIDAQLQPFLTQKVVKGFRHVLQSEPDPNFMLEPTFIKGLKRLAHFGFTYDLLIFAHQLPQAISLVSQLPELLIVLDHIAKPAIKTGEGFEEWFTRIEALAQYSNVHCKVSGMVTEANVNNWVEADFEQYLTVIFKAFGPERVMFGSDWPVCLLGGTYQSVKAIVDNFVNKHYPQFSNDVFGLNAKLFYKI